MKHVWTLVVLAVALAACQPQPAQPVDLATIEQRLDDIEQQVASIGVAVGGQLAGLEQLVDDRLTSVESDFVALRDLAEDVYVTVRQPLDLSDVDLASITGMTVEIAPGNLSLMIEPGACDEELPGRESLPGGTTTLTTFYQAPAGPHCLYTMETDGYMPTAQTIDVEPGAIAYVALIAEPKP